MKKGKRPRIIILCTAYNVQNYIDECIKSVLAQTYDNWIFVLRDNASTDDTREHIKKYLDDPRIIFLETDVNSILYPKKANVPDWTKIVEPTADDYITTIDADDYLDTDGIQKMVEAMLYYDADIVLGGCRMFDENDHRKYIYRMPKKNAFYREMKDCASDWIDFYGSVRVRWGNLYKYELFRNGRQETAKKYFLTNGTDTLLNLYVFNMANNMATINQVVVHYRIRHSSGYHRQINVKRYIAYDLIQEETVNLLQKWGCRDVEIYRFVEQCRASSMQDLIQNISASRTNYEEHCQLLYNIFTDEEFAEGLSWINARTDFFKSACKLLAKNSVLMGKWRKENFVTELVCGVVKKNKKLFFKGLFSVDNVCGWGMESLDEMLRSLSPWIGRIFEHTDFRVEFRKNRENIRLVAGGDYAKAAVGMDGVNLTALLDYAKEHE